MKNPEAVVAKLVESALRRYAMIERGDRVLVAVSGGKDSTTLACDLAVKRSWWPEPFEIAAVHVASDFGPRGLAPRLRSLLEGLKVPYEEISVPVVGRLKPGRSMNCYWCSTQRRTELLEYARTRGFNKIALGHHMDDILETFFMNMTEKGELSTMLPFMRYDRYPVSIIRPLALCEERQIEAFAAFKGFDSVTCSCDFGSDSSRRIVRSRLAVLTGGSGAVKRRIYEAMSRVRADYLPSEAPESRPARHT